MAVTGHPGKWRKLDFNQQYLGYQFAELDES